MSTKSLTVLSPHGLRAYSQITRVKPCPQWQPGDWTDDTDQMLCILDSLLACQALDVRDIATRLNQWAINNGFGIGSTVYNVVHHPKFLSSPMKVAEEYWESTGRLAAANGGIMRTSILGIWEYPDARLVRENAEKVCKITHADPRCVGSCVAVCLTIRQLLLGVGDIERLIDSVASQVQSYHPEFVLYFEKAREDSLDPLDLDEGMNPGEKKCLGYTLKTMGAGFWALMHARTFDDGILKIIHEGGDSDTNAAVAGALLGARFGFQGIYSPWRERLVHREELELRYAQLIKMCDKWENQGS